MRIFLRQEVFDKTMESKDFDPRLSRLTNQSQVRKTCLTIDIDSIVSQDYARDYVELVLYPELFISWVGRMRRCKQMVRRGEKCAEE